MNLKCKIITDFDFVINHNMINFVYQPILGKKIINIYKGLIEYKELMNQLGTNLSSNLDEISNYLEIEQKELLDSLKYLEALNLVQEYIEIYKQQEIIIKLNSTLSWKNFINEPKYLELLKTKLDNNEYEKLKLLFNNNLDLHYVNNSKSFEQIFNLKTNQYSIDFNLFYDYLFKKTNQLISLDDQNKIILNNAYKKYHFHYNELINFINKSLFKNDSNELVIDNKLLALNIKQYLDQNNIKNFNLNLKINRNAQIFLKNTSLNDFKYVIEDYKSLNANHYLACIQKHYLDDQQIEMINDLKHNFHLCDYVINILIDYCIYKNKGRIEINYIKKLALTINRLNLENVESILNHLRNQYTKNDSNKEIINKLEVNW